MNFIRCQFDKILLTGLLLIYCGTAMVAYRTGGAPALAAFATDQAKTFGGALLGLITGHAIASQHPPEGGAH